jgi:thiol-disulfide isomerase/thioredoxin
MLSQNQCSSVMGLVLIAWSSFAVSAAERVITFPADSSVGVITVTDYPRQVGPKLQFDLTIDLTMKAEGSVSVPDDAFIGLQVGNARVEQLDWLDSLPADAIQSLQFSRVHVTHDLLEKVTRLTGLIDLQFQSCTFDKDAFVNLPPLPLLQQLNASDVTGSGYARWVAGLPRLHNLFVSPNATVEQLESIGPHPTLGWTTTRLGSDAKETLQQLGRLPALRVLGVKVKERAKPEDFSYVADLASLEELRWFFGKLDGNVLKAIGKNGKLSTLILVNVEIGDNFLEGLEALTQLTELELASMYDLPFTSDQLVQTLTKLTHLEKWPLLAGISSNSLQLISEHRPLKQLTLRSKGDDVELKQLQAVGNLTNLTHLELHNVDIDDEWLKCLKNLHQLEYLRLFDTEVDGHGFANLSGLSNLSRVDIFNTSIDGAWTVPKLAALAEIPNLRELQMGGSFSKDDLLPLVNLKSLRSLRLWGGGFSDDSTAEMLSGMDQLISLAFSDECVISDKGAAALSKMTNLETLVVVGFITEAGVRQLASLPSLRRLVVATSLISEDEQKELKNSIRVPSFHLVPYTGSIVMGNAGELKKRDNTEETSVQAADGILRRVVDKDGGRTALDALEGQAAPDLGGVIGDEKFDLQSLRGKVVLVEFWGTWCGPCRLLNPQLKELYNKYHEDGFTIVGVHTADGSEEMADYLKDKNILWPNIIDQDDGFKKTYAVPHFPSLYLIDREGILRVALLHTAGLDEAVASMLHVKAKVPE